MNGSNRPIRRYKRRAGASATAVIIVLLVVVVALSFIALILALCGAFDGLFTPAPPAGQVQTSGTDDPLPPPDSSGSSDSSSDSSSGQNPPPTESGGDEQSKPPVVNPPIDQNQWLTLEAVAATQGHLVLLDNNHPYSFPIKPPATNLYNYRYDKGIQSYFSLKNSSLVLHTEAAEQLAAMLVAFADETKNKNIVIWEAYRSYEDQEDKYSPTNPKACKPGCSDYHTGNAVYLKYKDEEGYFHDISSTALYADWFEANAHKYGFVMRYPKDKEAYTGTITDGESHYRYVGVAHATAMKERGLCLEEYLEFVKSFTLSGNQLSVKVGETTYRIYSVPLSADGVTKVPIPTVPYTVSGDNMSTVILCETLT